MVVTHTNVNNYYIDDPLLIAIGLSLGSVANDRPPTQLRNVKKAKMVALLLPRFIIAVSC